MMKNVKRKKKRRTRLGIIVRLYKEGFLEDRVFWNLLGSKFKKAELLEMEKTFKMYYKKGIIQKKNMQSGG